MKSTVVVLILAGITLCINIGIQAQPHAHDKETLQQEALEIIQRFGTTLKPWLQDALKSGGPHKAIQVCSIQASDLAATLSEETGWTVKRVSLKPRNHQTATPDTWEQKILLRFEAQLTEGSHIQDLVHSEFVDGEFRVMKAQGVAPLCLQCHGESIAPSVKKTLRKFYPNDTATGYSPGQIRGAFSLSKKPAR